jgi:hypothetical protein
LSGTRCIHVQKYDIDAACPEKGRGMVDAVLQENSGSEHPEHQGRQALWCQDGTDIYRVPRNPLKARSTKRVKVRERNCPRVQETGSKIDENEI